MNHLIKIMSTAGHPSENPSRADVFGEDVSKVRKDQERFNAIASVRSLSMIDDRVAVNF